MPLTNFHIFNYDPISTTPNPILEGVLLTIYHRISLTRLTGYWGYDFSFSLKTPVFVRKDNQGFPCMYVSSYLNMACSYVYTDLPMLLWMLTEGLCPTIYIVLK